MTKLVLAVVHDLDADNVVTALEERGRRLTRIPSIGGLLGMENTTLLLGVEDSELESVLSTIDEYCASRDIELPLVIPGRLKEHLPRLIRHGGATIFIADLDRIVRI